MTGIELYEWAKSVNAPDKVLEEISDWSFIICRKSPSGHDFVKHDETGWHGHWCTWCGCHVGKAE